MIPIFRLAIVLVVVIGVLVLTYTEKMRTRDAITLIGMILAYLFGTGT
jgi:hypothetical protein